MTAKMVFQMLDDEVVHGSPLTFGGISPGLEQLIHEGLDVGR